MYGGTTVVPHRACVNRELTFCVYFCLWSGQEKLKKPKRNYSPGQGDQLSREGLLLRTDHGRYPLPALKMMREHHWVLAEDEPVPLIPPDLPGPSSGIHSLFCTSLYTVLLLNPTTEPQSSPLCLS